MADNAPFGFIYIEMLGDHDVLLAKTARGEGYELNLGSWGGYIANPNPAEMGELVNWSHDLSPGSCVVNVTFKGTINESKLWLVQAAMDGLRFNVGCFRFASKSVSGGDENHVHYWTRLYANCNVVNWHLEDSAGAVDDPVSLTFSSHGYVRSVVEQSPEDGIHDLEVNLDNKKEGFDKQWNKPQVIVGG